MSQLTVSRATADALDVMSTWGLALASEVSNWTLWEALAVIMWLLVAVLLLRRRSASEPDPELVANTRRSLIVLTVWVCLIAWRLATHTWD